jgi:GH18 family chitinase
MNELHLSNVDYVNIEAFDYYGPWDKRTSLSAPLMQLEEQYLTEAFFNIVNQDFYVFYFRYFFKALILLKDGTVSFIKAMGMSPSKMVLGLAAYARSYVLKQKQFNQINAQTDEKGFSGTFTKTNGILSYYEVKNNKIYNLIPIKQGLISIIKRCVIGKRRAK